MITPQTKFVIRMLLLCALWNDFGLVVESHEADNLKHYDEEGNHYPEYDHEAFLGDEAKTFDNLTPKESKERLGIIVNKIDYNKDNIITHIELKDWIKYTQDKYVRDNVDRAWRQYNPENNEGVSWDNYSDHVYAFMKDLSPEEINKQEGGVSYKILYERDRRRWVASDADGDDLLNKIEFSAFLHPEDYPYMRDLIVQETIEEMDKDNDGKISLHEYIEDMHQGNGHVSDQPTWVESEIENFNKHRDGDQDGYLTGEEIRDIVIPEGFDHSDAEAKHLISEADANGDGYLTKEEIIAKYDLFVGSQATDFGEALMRHDEF